MQKTKIFSWLKVPPETANSPLPRNDGIVLPAGMLKFFSPAECQEILRCGKETADEQAAATSDGTSDNVNYANRISTVRTIYPYGKTSWIFDRLENACAQLHAHFKMDVAGFFEGAQIYYYPLGGYLNWHMDIGRDYMSTRKLSITVQLSDDHEYDGGDLEFMSSSQKMPRALGSIVVFPAYMMHRVAPVTRGGRYSLVSWIHGPPFR